jgi:chromosome segregation ATPase
MKESASDFSIVKNYFELKTKYDTEMRTITESSRAQEGKYKGHIAMLEGEIAKRNDYIKAQEAKLQELTQKNAELTEQVKNLGNQLNRLKMGSPATGGAAPAEKSSKFGIFK